MTMPGAHAFSQMNLKTSYISQSDQVSGPAPNGGASGGGSAAGVSCSAPPSTAPGTPTVKCKPATPHGHSLESDYHVSIPDPQA